MAHFDPADAEDVFGFASRKLVGRLVGCDAVLIEPAQLFFRLEYRHRVPQHGEAVRTREARRPSTDHGDLATGGRRAFEQGSVVFEDRIRGVALQQSDAYRAVFVRVAYAGLLAQHFRGTHARAHAAHDVFAQNGVRRALEVAAANLLDETGNVDAGGAGGGAGCVVTEVAAVGVDDGFGRGQRGVHVREVRRDLLFGEAPCADVGLVSHVRFTAVGALSSICFFTAS